jgi:hypothetical protein
LPGRQWLALAWHRAGVFRNPSILVRWPGFFFRRLFDVKADPEVHAIYSLMSTKNLRMLLAAWWHAIEKGEPDQAAEVAKEIIPALRARCFNAPHRAIYARGREFWLHTFGAQTVIRSRPAPEN